MIEVRQLSRHHGPAAALRGRGPVAGPGVAAGQPMAGAEALRAEVVSP